MRLSFNEYYFSFAVFRAGNPGVQPNKDSTRSWGSISEKALSQWVSKHEKRDNLTPDQIVALDVITFPWVVSNDERWEIKFEDLCRYNELNGNCKVPRTYGPLGSWVKNQRAAYKKRAEGKNTSLTQDMIDKLERIGFEWEIKVSPLTWDESFGMLKQYAEENGGDTSVPRAQNQKLGRWVAEQRTQYKLKMDGQKSNMTEDRVHKLNSIDFEWAVRNGRSPKKNAAPKKTAASKTVLGCTIYENHFV